MQISTRTYVQCRKSDLQIAESFQDARENFSGKNQAQESANFNCLQSAYRRGHSTETTLWKTLNDNLSERRKLHSRTPLFQLDLSAAFDTLDKSTQLHRLKFSFDIDGGIYIWINSHLDGRHQSVGVGGQTSAPKACEFGIPQAPVLAWVIIFHTLHGIVQYVLTLSTMPVLPSVPLIGSYSLPSDDYFLMIDDLSPGKSSLANGLCLDPDATL
jgi:Reverse transcriptase (RNA-dependent DNA polymerase)